jgi:hypothetical protein
MKHYEATADIDASADSIWAVLTDGPGYADWDSGLIELDGTVAPGEKLKLRPEVNPKRTFPVAVTEFDAPTRMTWTGGMPLGLFKGVRTFRLEPTAGAGATRFTMREEYSGPMLPLIWRSMPDLGPSFQQFARGLKERAERR